MFFRVQIYRPEEGGWKDTWWRPHGMPEPESPEGIRLTLEEAKIGVKIARTEITGKRFIITKFQD